MEGGNSRPFGCAVPALSTNRRHLEVLLSRSRTPPACPAALRHRGRPTVDGWPTRHAGAGSLPALFGAVSGTKPGRRAPPWVGWLLAATLCLLAVSLGLAMALRQHLSPLPRRAAGAGCRRPSTPGSDSTSPAAESRRRSCPPETSASPSPSTFPGHPSCASGWSPAARPPSRSRSSSGALGGSSVVERCPRPPTSPSRCPRPAVCSSWPTKASSSGRIRGWCRRPMSRRPSSAFWLSWRSPARRAGRLVPLAFPRAAWARTALLGGLTAGIDGRPLPRRSWRSASGRSGTACPPGSRARAGTWARWTRIPAGRTRRATAPAWLRASTPSASGSTATSSAWGTSRPASFAIPPTASLSSPMPTASATPNRSRRPPWWRPWATPSPTA